MRHIPYGKQDINQEDIDQVVEVLRSDFITQGPKIEQFEKALQVYCQCPHAIALANGTAALQLALLGLGVGTGDRVWTSPISFVASANAALLVGATIDFVDCDPITANMDIAQLTKKLAAAKKAKQLPKAIIIVHFAGRPCDMKAVQAIAKEYNVFVIEDAAHALGGKYDDRTAIGSGAFSDAVTFSFHPVKSLTTGEGGAVMTKNTALADNIRLLRTHGITRNSSQMRHVSEGDWYYEQTELGFNYRLTDIQAALGISQLKRLDEFVEQRARRAKIYQEALQGVGCELLPYATNSAWHLYVVLLPNNKMFERASIFKALRMAGIGVNVHYIPIHTQPYYQDLGFKKGDFPNAESYYARTLTLPLFPKLKKEEQDYVVSTLKTILIKEKIS